LRERICWLACGITGCTAPLSASCWCWLASGLKATKDITALVRRARVVGYTSRQTSPAMRKFPERSKLSVPCFQEAGVAVL